MSAARSIGAFVCASCRGLQRPPSSSPARRLLSTTSTTCADQNQKTSTDDAARQNLSLLNQFTTPKASSAPRTSDSSYTTILRGMDAPPDPASLISPVSQPAAHRLNLMFTKRNTHMTLSAPPPATPDGDPFARKPSKVLLSLSTGNIGFRKAGRGSYDAAFQLAAFVFKKIQERALLRGDVALEVIFRGYGQGREAVSKAMMGQEGRLMRHKICTVIDATRLKIGGSRSRKPRRLG